MQFYKINDASKKGRILLFSEPEIPIEDSFKFIRGEYPIKDGHIAKVDEGVYWRDFNAHNCNGLAVSKRIRDILLENKATGITFTKLNIQDHLEQEYYTIQVISNPVSESLPFSEGCHTGIELNLEEWDGSDFFLTRTKLGISARIICTEKIFTLLNKGKYTNIGFTLIEEVEQYITQREIEAEKSK